MFSRILPMGILFALIGTNAGQLINVGEKIKNTAKIIITEIELRNIYSMLTLEEEFPKNQKEFERFLEKNFMARGGRKKISDPFGMKYYYRLTQEFAEVRSPGPDKKIHTKDDIYIRITF